MKLNNKKNIIALLFLSAVFFICGMITQKKYGLGNIIKLINPIYLSSSEPEHLKTKHQGSIDIYIYILAGQSNMEGDGDENIQSLNDGKIYVFNENYKWVLGKEPLREKFGPSMSIAKVLSKNTYKPVGIINVAVGGTNISQWQKSFSENSHYQLLLKRALASQSQGKIKGEFFLQGENDAEGDDTDHYNDWNVQFENFINDLRADLKNDSLPVIFGQIGKGDTEYWLKVKNSQEKVSLSNVEMIKTDDLDYKPGEIHYDSKGYQIIGERFGNKYIQEFIKNRSIY